MTNLQLTIDDGPTPLSALEPILKTLEEQKVTTCFFVLGETSATNRSGLIKITEKGHFLGNHSWAHLEKYRKNAASEYSEGEKKAILGEFTSTHEELKKAGYVVKYWRSPRGDQAIREICEKELMKKYGYLSACDWHVDSKDSQGASTANEMLGYIRTAIKQRAGRRMQRMLFHVKPTTASALPKVLEGLQKDGHKLVDFSQDT